MSHLSTGRLSKKAHPMDNQLYHHPLFLQNAELLSTDERVSLSYRRARLICQTYRKGPRLVVAFIMLT
jgi:hypothetical protein